VRRVEREGIRIDGKAGEKREEGARKGRERGGKGR
jgi:hypothetical protein